MKIRVKVSASLFTCGTCGNGYSNPITHVCRVPFSELGAKRVKARRSAQGKK